MQLMGNGLEKLFATRIQHAFSGNLAKIDVISEGREGEGEREREKTCVWCCVNNVLYYMLFINGMEWRRLK